MKIKADFHVHTEASPDGRSSLEAITRSAAAKGINAIAVTDHNAITEHPEFMNGVLLVRACEFSTKAGHITGLFLYSDPVLAPVLPEAETVVNEIRRCGGVAVIAHPYQQGLKKLPDADAVETANSRAAMKVRNANALAAEYAKRCGLPEIGGSDAHSAKEVGTSYTELEVSELTTDELRKAVLKGRAVLVSECSHFTKSLSQLKKAFRSRSAGKIAKGFAYVGVCIARDIKRLICH